MVIAVTAAGVSAGVSVLKSAYELVRDLRKSNDITELKDGLDELTSRLLSAREEAVRLSEERDALMAEVKTLKTEAAKRVAFEDKAKKYTLVQARGGAFVYVEKEPTDSNAPSPYFCPHCFENKTLSILQITGQSKQVCPSCKTGFQIFTFQQTRVEGMNSPFDY